jgi:hypothetical protein
VAKDEEKISRPPWSVDDALRRELDDTARNMVEWAEARSENFVDDTKYNGMREEKKKKNCQDVEWQKIMQLCLSIGTHACFLIQVKK